MPSTGFIPAISAEVLSGNVSDINNMTGDGSGNTILIDSSEILLTFDIPSTVNIPLGSTINGIRIKYGGVFTTVNYVVTVQCNFILDNVNFPNGLEIEAAGGGPYASLTSNSPFGLIEEDILAQLLLKEATSIGSADILDELAAGTFVSTVVPEIITGDSTLKLKIISNDYSFGGEVAITGAIPLPGIEIRYEPPPSGIKSKIIGAKVKLSNSNKITIKNT